MHVHCTSFFLTHTHKLIEFNWFWPSLFISWLSFTCHVSILLYLFLYLFLYIYTYIQGNLTVKMNHGKAGNTEKRDVSTFITIKCHLGYQDTTVPSPCCVYDLSPQCEAISKPFKSLIESLNYRPVRTVSSSHLFGRSWSLWVIS